jgi:beta-glucosidase
VKDVERSVIRPEKELKGFEKVGLEPGEEKDAIFVLDKRAFAYFDTEIGDWQVENGVFEIQAGSSSRDIHLIETVRVQASIAVQKKYHINSTIGDILADGDVTKQGQQLLDYLTGEGGLLSSLKDNPEMAEAMAKYLPLRAILSFSGEKVEEAEIVEILQEANRIKDGR